MLRNWKFLHKLEISKALIFWYLPIGYLSGILAFSYQERVVDKTLQIQIVAVTSTLFTVGFLAAGMWIERRTFKLGRKLPVAPTFILIVGSLRGFVIHYLGVWLDLESGLSLLNRALVSTGSTLFWLGFLSFLLTSHNKYRARYRKLLSRLLLEKSIGLTDENLKEQLKQVEDSLKSIQIDSSNDYQFSDSLRHLASEVQLRIEESIRPISKRLWLSSLQEYPKVGFLASLKHATRHLQYSSTVVSTLALIISMSTLVTFMPIGEAVGRTFLTIICLIVLTQIFNQARTRFFTDSLTTSLVFLALISFTPTLLGDVIFSISHYRIDNPISLAVFLVLPTLLIGTSYLSTLQQDQMVLLSRLESNLGESGSQSLQAKQAASYLHNSLQSELLSISKKLEQAAASEGDVDARPILERLGALINRSISNDFQHLYGDPKSRLSQIIENWKGIINIQIENTELLFLYPEKAVLGVQLIEELASNLAKHSDSTKIKIFCSETQGYIYLEVQYPNYIESQSDLGMGSDLLNILRAEDVTPSKSRLTGLLRFEI